MVTISTLNGRPVHANMSLDGLSGDDKPLKTFEGVAIGNGSTFFEMDTGAVWKYDEENEVWYEI